VELNSGEEPSMVVVVLSLDGIYSRHDPAYVFDHLIVQGIITRFRLDFPRTVEKSTGLTGE
jgi:hypothetical protein